MSKKRKKAVPVQPKKAKDEVVWRQSSEEATLAAKPRYNGFACGHGAHGSAKYSRARAKQAWQRQMRQEGASRGSFPFMGARRDPGAGRPQRRCCVAPGGGGAADLAGEGGGEGARARIAHGAAHLGQGEVRAGQKLAGALHPQVPQLLGHAAPALGLVGGRQTRAAHAQFAGDGLQRERRVQMALQQRVGVAGQTGRLAAALGGFGLLFGFGGVHEAGDGLGRKGRQVQLGRRGVGRSGVEALQHGAHVGRVQTWGVVAMRSSRASPSGRRPKASCSQKRGVKHSERDT